MGKSGGTTRREGRPRLADVARRANVSVPTASRVINRPEIVRSELRDRVQAAIEELSYSPDRKARALLSGKSQTVGAIIPTLGFSPFAVGVEALQNRLEELGYTLILANSQYDLDREAAQLQALIEQGVDGVVLVGDRFAPEALDRLRQYEIPVVTTYVAESKNGIPAIGIDNALAMVELTERLLALGHRKFGIVSNSRLSNDRSAARRDGVLTALREAGIRLSRDRIAEVDNPRITDGRAAFRDLLETASDITAMVCTTDSLAVGVIAEARVRGISVPDDMTVSGFDDIEFAGQFDPAVTTVHNPAAAIGQFAAEHIVSAINGEDIPMSVRMPARIIERASTAPPRARSTSGRRRRASARAATA